MSGVAIVRYLLTQDGTLTASVPTSRIATDDNVPLNSALPAIETHMVSANRRSIVSLTLQNVMVTERVQVTVNADDAAERITLLKRVGDVLPRSHGTVNGFTVDSILPDIEGPSYKDEEERIYIGSRDFIVRWIDS